jgi:deoxyribodipyrimidine photo-lyase
MGDVVWLRRDLRRADLPILGRAAESGPVTVAFVVDPPLWETSAGSPRRGWLATTLLALRETYEGCLTLRTGDPRTEIPRLATEVGASAVHISEETEPDGSAQDQDVEKALGDVPLSSTGSPYAVTPGRVRTGSGGAYQRFTPFSTAWREHGWRAPASEPADLALAEDLSDEKVWKVVAEAAAEPGPDQPPAGETAALERWHEFLDDHLGTYDANRDRPDLRATSGLSPYLKLGVLHHNPSSLWDDLRPELATMAYDDSPELVEAWRQGRTGVPLVDAGMRQLLATGWMHNRVRMVTASFLIKHLHTRWQVGAQHFLDHLIDADLASNQHGWQWVAGTGTDAAPYFRVFNPVLQGEKFDPDAAYIRRWIPELSGLEPSQAHHPWTVDNSARNGYPEPIVDLDAERRDALARHQAARS